MARYTEPDERYISPDDFGSVIVDSSPETIRLVSQATDQQNTRTTTPDALTANVNDYSLSSGFDYFRLSTDGVARTITGFANVQGGRRVTISNVAGGANITLNNQDAASTAENRIITGTGGNVAILPDETRVLWYDYVSTRWRLVR